MIASKGGPASAGAAARASAGAQPEDPQTRLVHAFERAVAEDTVRNQYLLHSPVHEWFAGGTAPASLEELNERVYPELFLMRRTGSLARPGAPGRLHRPVAGSDGRREVNAAR